jgi:hypothetical protein
MKGPMTKQHLPGYCDRCGAHTIDTNDLNDDDSFKDGAKVYWNAYRLSGENAEKYGEYICSTCVLELYLDKTEAVFIGDE